MSDPTQRFAAALSAVEEELDWVHLGTLYCSEGGEGFFSDEQRAAMTDAGLHFAADLGERLEPGGRSLYLGVGVAELAPILFEHLVLERDVRLVTLPGDEPAALDAAFAAAEARTGLRLPRFVTRPLPEPERADRDHLWMVSVLTDPEAFPSLHDDLYGRKGGPLGVGGGHPKAERERAARLVARALGHLRRPAWVTTSDEELPVVLRVAEDLGLALDSPPVGRLSGVVGDPVRHHSLRARKGGGGGRRRGAPGGAPSRVRGRSGGDSGRRSGGGGRGPGPRPGGSGRGGRPDGRS